MHTRISRILVVIWAMLASWLFLPAVHRADGADDCCGRPRTCAEGETPGGENGNNCESTESGPPLHQRTDHALLLAARYGRLELVKQLLDEGAGVDTKGGLDQTALMEAAGNGHVNVVQLLLDRGADVNAKDDFLQTALMLAAGKGHLAVVSALLKSGADVNGRSGFGSTALMDAVRECRLDVARELIHGGADVNATDKHGESILIKEVRKGIREIVQLLLDLGADCNIQDKEGNSALKIAIRRCDLEMATLLRSRGAKSNENPLVLAAYLGEEKEVARLLGQGADANEKDRFYDRTALMWAAEQGHPEVAKLLLDKGADVNAKTGEGWTALMSGGVGGDLEVVRLLLDKGANVNAEDSFHRRTALTLAREAGHPKVVRLLAQRGALLTLGLATELEDLEAIRRLIREGADVNAGEGDGSTPLRAAARSGTLEVVILLLEKGADVNAKDGDGSTPLMAAALSGTLEVVILLLEKGADVNAKDGDGSTPLGYASGMGKLEMVKLLLEKGADVNAKEADGSTPLINAALSGNLEMVKLLLEKGADVNARAENEWTALMQAILNGHQLVAQLLKDSGADLDERSGMQVEEARRRLGATIKQSDKEIDDSFKTAHERSMDEKPVKRIPPAPFSLAFSRGKDGKTGRIWLTDAFDPGREVVLLLQRGTCAAKTGKTTDHDCLGDHLQSTPLEETDKCPKSYEGVAVVGTDARKVQLISPVEAPILVPREILSGACTLLMSLARQEMQDRENPAVRTIKIPGISLLVFDFEDGKDGLLVLDAHGIMSELDGWCTSGHVFFTVNDKLHLAFISACCGCDWRYLVVYDLSGTTPEKVYVNRIPSGNVGYPNDTSKP